MALYQLGDDAPRIPASAYVSNEATVIGKVTIGELSSVWPSATVRGDNEPIRIGNSVNIQDGAVLHVDPGCPLTIGDFVSVGHQAMLHGCTVGEGSLIGINAVILNRAVIGKHCLIGAKALIPEGKAIPDRSLVLGSPGRVIRELTDEEVARLLATAGRYVAHWQHYARELRTL